MNGFKFLEFITEAIGWLQIVLSPLLIAMGVSAVIYFSHPTTTNLVLGIIITAMGLIIGVIWANSTKKEGGTMQFLSRVSSTPELDDPVEKEHIDTKDSDKDNMK